MIREIDLNLYEMYDGLMFKVDIICYWNPKWKVLKYKKLMTTYFNELVWPFSSISSTKRTY